MKVEVLTCDRCGSRDEVVWSGKLWVEGSDTERHFDLCTKCEGELGIDFRKSARRGRPRKAA